MLSEENQIINHRYLPQRKLDRIARHTTPVSLHRAINDKLRNTQHAARKVEQNLPNAPAHRALVAVVGHHLRGVLDERDPQLDIADRIHGVEPAPVHPGVHHAFAILWHGRRNKHHDGKHTRDAAKCRAENEARRAVACGRGEAPERWEEVLRGGDERQHERVQGKHNVVERHGRRVSAVARGVLSANDWAIVKGEIGDEVGEEAETVDEREVDGGARGGFAAGVEDGLGIERGGPAYCVDPAKEAGKYGEKTDDHFSLCLLRHACVW